MRPSMDEVLFVFIKWSFSVIVYALLLPTVLVVSPILSLFTEPKKHGKKRYTWGGIYGTYDNPPQGDEGYVAKRGVFPNEEYGWKGYVNRVVWIIRNPLYGLKRKLSINFNTYTNKRIYGNPEISDKYKIPGWMVCLAFDKFKLVAFEIYCVFPYSKRRNVRIRMGWKIKGRKFTKVGHFAPLVFTFNPFDSYGNV